MIRAVHANENMAKPGKYLIVKFECDGDRKIIPDVWFKNGKFFWPPRKGQEESKKRTVIKSSWSLLPVEDISSHGNFSLILEILSCNNFVSSDSYNHTAERIQQADGGESDSAAAFVALGNEAKLGDSVKPKKFYCIYFKNQNNKQLR